MKTFCCINWEREKESIKNYTQWWWFKCAHWVTISVVYDIKWTCAHAVFAFTLNARMCLPLKKMVRMDRTCTFTDSRKFHSFAVCSHFQHNIKWESIHRIFGCLFDFFFCGWAQSTPHFLQLKPNPCNVWFMLKLLL